MHRLNSKDVAVTGCDNTETSQNFNGRFAPSDTIATDALHVASTAWETKFALKIIW
jgi:hypothetical protein